MASPIEIREYCDADFDSVSELASELHQYLYDMDPLRILLGKNFKKNDYTKELLRLVKSKHGALFVANLDGVLCGYSAGILIERDTMDLLEVRPIKAGIILDLIVTRSMRSNGCGTELLASQEAFFEKSGCKLGYVDVFAPNTDASLFYGAHGYSPRISTLIKSFRKL